MSQARRALVTGGAGFIGPHLVERLVEHGCDVTVFDNLSVGRISHVERFLEDPSFSFVEGDVADRVAARRVVEQCDPDLVYHLAALHFIPACVANPWETLRTNVVGTQCLLDAIVDSGVRNFVLASTADVYLPRNFPHAEGDPKGSGNIYGQSKHFCEQLLDLSRARAPGVAFTVARLFNVYGPGETNPHVIPDILAALRERDSLPLGNVDAGRDYVWASDVAEALVRLGEYDGDARILNVGTGRETSVRQIVGVMAEILGRDLSIEVDPRRLRPVDRPHLCADTSRLAQALGWIPDTGLVEGLGDLLRAEGLLG